VGESDMGGGRVAGCVNGCKKRNKIKFGGGLFFGEKRRHPPPSPLFLFFFPIPPSPPFTRCCLVWKGGGGEGGGNYLHLHSFVPSLLTHFGHSLGLVFGFGGGGKG